jgi:hypothetical protein
LGGVEGAITPAAVFPQVDMVQVRLPLPAGEATQTLIVRSSSATVSATSETYSLSALPVTPPSTTYWVVVERFSDSSGTEPVATTSPLGVAVTPGPPATANVTVPP